MRLLMMGRIKKRNRLPDYAPALESEFRSTVDCGEDVAESGFLLT